MKPIFIVGMGRSGTSAVSSIVKALGFNMGGNISIGYDTWEHPAVVQLNQMILTELGYHPLDPPPAIGYEDVQGSLRELAHAQASGMQGPWAWKDGQLAHLLGFWSEIVDFRLIGVFRNPEAVAQSGLGAEWEDYHHAVWRCWGDMGNKILDSHRHRETLTVQYEELMLGTEGVVVKIAEFCEAEGVEDAVRAVIK